MQNRKGKLKITEMGEMRGENRVSLARIIKRIYEAMRGNFSDFREGESQWADEKYFMRHKRESE